MIKIHTIEIQRKWDRKGGCCLYKYNLYQAHCGDTSKHSSGLNALGTYNVHSGHEKRA